jgi:hypothetical protein
MSLEEDLRSTLHRRAEMVTMPPTAWPSIERKVSGQGRRTMLARAVTVAVALAAAAGAVTLLVVIFTARSGPVRVGRSDSSASVWASLGRPLHVPSVTDTCPATPLTTLQPIGGGFTGSITFRGTGPAYVTADPAAEPAYLLRPAARTPQGWYIMKTLWAMPPTYQGPMLVRGAQLLGEGGIGFAMGNADAPLLQQLKLDTGNGSDNEWWSEVTATFVRSSGCFAYQIDGTTFSQVIVFQVRG